MAPEAALPAWFLPQFERFKADLLGQLVRIVDVVVATVVAIVRTVAFAMESLTTTAFDALHVAVHALRVAAMNGDTEKVMKIAKQICQHEKLKENNGTISDVLWVETYSRKSTSYNGAFNTLIETAGNHTFHKFLADLIDQTPESGRPYDYLQRLLRETAKDGVTPALRICRYHKVDTLQLLINVTGPEVLNARSAVDSMNRNAMWYALMRKDEHGQKWKVKKEEEHKIKRVRAEHMIKHLYSRDDYGFTTYYMEDYLEACDDTPLHWAAREYRTLCFRPLLECMPVPDEQKHPDDRKKEVLHVLQTNDRAHKKSKHGVIGLSVLDELCMDEDRWKTRADARKIYQEIDKYFDFDGEGREYRKSGDFPEGFWRNKQPSATGTVTHSARSSQRPSY